MRDVTQFIRVNPIISGATLGGSVLAGLTLSQVVRSVRRRRKPPTRRRKAPKKRRVRRRRVAKMPRRKRRKKHVTHRSPRHKGHKRVSFTTKTGQRVNFLVKKSKGRRRK